MGSHLLGRVRWRCRGSLVVLGVVGLLLGMFGPVVADAGGDAEQARQDTAINALAVIGILDDTDCKGESDCLDEMIERWVAAVWLVRALEGGPSAPVDTSRFEDVDAGQWWAPYVERLVELGVTRGCATEPDRFCPDSPVTRGQMATFLARALRLEPVDVVGFIDVAGNRHRENIGAAAAAGIVQGCPTGSFRFCPGAEVTRGEMAVSLASALDLIAPLPAAPVGRFAFTSAQGNDEIFVMDADGSKGLMLL